MDDKPTISQRAFEQSSAPPPSYQSAVRGTREAEFIPGGSWQLACTIPPGSRCLSLNEEGIAVWRDTSKAGNGPSGGRYRWDGFDVDLTGLLIKLTIQSYMWLCERDSMAGNFLLSPTNDLSLENFGKHLAIFKRAFEIPEDRIRPSPKPREDKKGSLKVEAQVKENHPDIYCFTGTDIYQVQGDGDDLVIQSRQYLRLWDIMRKKFRWEKFSATARLSCLTTKYVVSGVGSYELRQRHNGYIYGEFHFPVFTSFTSLNEADHFGPVRSRNDLVLYKPSKEVLYLFEIGADTVELQAWESNAEVRGSLVLRGSLQDLHLQLLGQSPEWTKSKVSVPISKNRDWFRKYVLDM